MPLGRLASLALVLGTAAAPAVVPAAPLAAQEPPSRSGLTIAFGLGGGTRGLECDGCEVDRESGMTAFLFVGGTLGPRLTLGGELNGWGKTTDDVEQSVASAMAVVHFYPVARRGLFVSGGAGLTSMAVDDGASEFRTEGFGIQLGAGWDFRVGSGHSITSYVQWVQGVGGDGEENGTDIGDANPDYLQFGLGFTWH